MPPPLPPGFLSPHFTVADLTHSTLAVRHGVDNAPGPGELASLQRMALLLEEVRALLGHVPITVLSGYRAPAVNRLAKGSKSSAHMLGLAADFIAPQFGDPLAICRRLAADGPWFFDQLIFERAWVHIALAPAGAQPRRDVRTAVFKPGQRTQYLPGLPSVA